jgi:ketosteroid isomerase-like protein
MPALRPSRTRTLIFAAALTATVAGPAHAATVAVAGHAPAQDHGPMVPAAQTTDSAAVAATVHAFHLALQQGDSAAARALLAHDLRVAESGGLETRDEYLSHHLPGDMAFASAVTREPGTLHVTVMGDVAWAMSSSRTSGTYRDRAINSVGAELMVLSREGDGWRIRAIHWSSRQAR